MTPISGLHADDARAVTLALVDISAAITESMDPDKVLEALAETAVPALADFVTVHAVESAGGPRLVAAVHRDPALQPVVREWGADYQTRSQGGGLLQALREQGMIRYEEISPELLDSVALDDRHREIQRALGMRSIVALPLGARGRMLGAVTLAFSDRSDRRWHSKLIDVAEALARQAGLALDNARLYTERSEVARILQASLLPQALPDIEGIDVAVRYRAAGRSSAVGGDCYDVFCAGRQAPSFLVADVVGKGAKAAALTGLVRHTLRAAYLRGEPPLMALGLVNEALIAADLPGRFCTAVHGHIHRDGDQVRIDIASAGHPPPLVLRRAGGVDEIDIPGLLLGVAIDAEFGHAEVVLDPGDTLLIYTDGATELHGVGPADGERLLHEQVAASVGRSAQEIVEGVERQALVASGGGLRDDLALLALQACPT